MNLWYELIYTIRLLRKKLGFVLLCALVVALGYAISIPLYTLTKNIAYAPLPFPDGERFVQVDQIDTASNSSLRTPSIDQFQFNVVSESAMSFERLGAYRDIGVAFNDGDVTQQFVATALTADALNMTAATPILGRLLLAGDDLPGAEPVVLLGHSVWQSYYGGQEGVLGRSARVNGVTRTIVGVMPPEFKYPLATDIWLPLSISATAEPGTEPLVTFVGVLNAGVDVAAASAELSAILQRLGTDYPDHYADRSAQVIPFIHLAFSGATTAFNFATALSMSIFVLVCLNIANLLTIRANERVTELAIRTALGARRSRLVINVLLESLLICLSGALLGMLAAKPILAAIESFIYNVAEDGRTVPFWFDYSYSSDVVLLASLMLVFLWLSSGAFAAWRASNRDISVILGSDSKGELALSDSRVVGVLVNVQVVVSFFLLIVSGVFLLMIQGFSSRDSVEEPERFYAAGIDLSAERYASEEDRQNYRDEFKQLLIGNGNIEAVTFASSIPGTGVRGFDVVLEEGNVNTEPDYSQHLTTWVSTNYFRVVDGSNLLQGRYFDERDRDAAVDVAIVDDAFIRRLQLDESPVGKSIRILDEDGFSVSAIIIGVVSGLSSELETPEGPTPIIYRPLNQNSPNRFQFIAKISSFAQPTFAELDEQIRMIGTRIDRDVSISYMNSLARIAENNFAMNQLVSSLFVNAAMASLLLALIGVYGSISRSVSVRRREIGIRRAIGSSDLSITNIFLKKGLYYWMAALFLGGGVATLAVNAIAGVISSQSIFPLFALVFVVVALLYGMLIAFSSYMPVRKVITLEPGVAMHYE